MPSFTKLAQQGFDVHLQEPEYHDGELSTTKGGIIKSKDMYVQAKCIKYINKMVGSEEVKTIEAYGDMLFTYKGKTYTGDKVVHNLITEKSVIYNGKTHADDWYLGGKRIELDQDGTGTIYDGYITTSENENREWSAEASQVELSEGGHVDADNITFRIGKVPVFWLPRYSKDLGEDSSSSSLKYRFQYDRNRGAIAGVVFKVADTKTWKSQFILDLGFRKNIIPRGLRPRGLGGGFETYYKNPNKIERFSMLNYYARDIKIANEDVRKDNRYMFQALYFNKFFDKAVNFKARFDKQSDPYVAGDYIKRSLDSRRVGKTQATFSQKKDDWLWTLNTRVRVNQFQSVKQELPLFSAHARPFSLGSTGLILDNQFSAGYLDYKYIDKMKRWSHVHDFHSSRIEFGQKLYKNFKMCNVSITPKIGYRAIGFSNSPQHDAKLLALANAGIECHTRLVRHFSNIQHAAEPYVQYDYYTAPSVGPKKHYIFDMQDGLYRANIMRFGVRNYIGPTSIEQYDKRLMLDLYSRAFFDTPTVARTVPKVNCDAIYNATKYSRYIFGTAWDMQHKKWDHVNLRGEFTVTDDIAFALEYRHRSAWSWRKVDPENFMIDTYRSQKKLRKSAMSDRRDTFLTHLFLRLTPDYSFEILTRHGWHRHDQSAYTEYEGRFVSILRGALKVTLSVQHAVKGETKFGLDLSFGGRAPSTSRRIQRLGHVNYLY